MTCALILSVTGGLPDTKITITQRHSARRFPVLPAITSGLRPNRNAR
jgi:hypothetical protein